MRVYVQRANAFDRYPRADSSSVKIIGHHHHGTIVHEDGGGAGSTRRGILSDVYCCCYMCVEMARDTPGSPMPRPRDLGAGGGGGAATATLTSGAYHAAAADTANMHGHALQQKILEVTYDRLPCMRDTWYIDLVHRSPPTFYGETSRILRDFRHTFLERRRDDIREINSFTIISILQSKCEAVFLINLRSIFYQIFMWYCSQLSSKYHTFL